MEEKARVGFWRIVVQSGLYPAGQEFSGQRIDASSRDGGRCAGVQDNSSTQLAGLKNSEVIFVKEFWRRDAMGDLPDMKIGLAVEPA